MNTPDDYEYKFQVVSTMMKYGGSFAKALAEAWIRADAHNKKRLEKCFEDIFREYEKLF